MTYIGRVFEGEVILPPEMVLVGGAEVLEQKAGNDGDLEVLLSTRAGGGT